jgi:hypothetical protein
VAVVKYFEYRQASGGIEETWLFYSAADQATDNVFLLLIEYRRTAAASDGMRDVEAYWCEGGPMTSTLSRANVPPMGPHGELATKAMLADSFTRLAAGVS